MIKCLWLCRFSLREYLQGPHEISEQYKTSVSFHLFVFGSFWLHVNLVCMQNMWGWVLQMWQKKWRKKEKWERDSIIIIVWVWILWLHRYLLGLKTVEFCGGEVKFHASLGIGLCVTDYESMVMGIGDVDNFFMVRRTGGRKQHGNNVLWL